MKWRRRRKRAQNKEISKKKNPKQRNEEEKSTKMIQTQRNEKRKRATNQEISKRRREKATKWERKRAPRGEKEGKDQKMTRKPKKRKTTKQGARYRATRICHEGGRHQNHSLDVRKFAGPFVQPQPPTPPEARTKRTLGLRLDREKHGLCLLFGGPKCM